MRLLFANQDAMISGFHILQGRKGLYISVARDFIESEVSRSYNGINKLCIKSVRKVT